MIRRRRFLPKASLLSLLMIKQRTVLFLNPVAQNFGFTDGYSGKQPVPASVEDYLSYFVGYANGCTAAISALEKTDLLSDVSKVDKPKKA